MADDNALLSTAGARSGHQSVGLHPRGMVASTPFTCPLSGSINKQAVLIGMQLRTNPRPHRQHELTMVGTCAMHE
jgi:hypothetical protein